jgi:hypothetical protein
MVFQPDSQRITKANDPEVYVESYVALNEYARNI